MEKPGSARRTAQPRVPTTASPPAWGWNGSCFFSDAVFAIVITVLVFRSPWHVRTHSPLRLRLALAQPHRAADDLLSAVSDSDAWGPVGRRRPVPGGLQCRQHDC